MAQRNIGDKLMGAQILRKTTLTNKPPILKPSYHTIPGINLACDCSGYSLPHLSPVALARPLATRCPASLQYFPIEQMIHDCFLAGDSLLALIAHSNDSDLDIGELGRQNSDAEGRLVLTRQHF